jgi:hypothetical protein
LRYLSLSLVALSAVSQAQTLDYQWLNMPCASMINCDTGCSACNVASGGNAVVMGNSLAWVGVDICPEPITTADNALFTYGWTAFPDNGHVLILSGLVLGPVRIDSLVIEHRASADGPQRVQVRYGVNQTLPSTVVADVQTTESFTRTVLTDLGSVAVGPGQVFGMFQLVLQPYGGQGGSWDLDAIRIVTVPDEPEATTTSIAEVSGPGAERSGVVYDVFGRPVQVKGRAMGMYRDGSRRVVLDQGW